MNAYKQPEPDAWVYDLGEGWSAAAGKTDRDNDLLTLRAAFPNDLWFHVHGMPGSHVVLSGPPGTAPDKQLIEQAASIAAWHSKARSGGQVSVVYTEVKNVSKPSRARPGSVNIRREKKIKVRPALPTA